MVRTAALVLAAASAAACFLLVLLNGARLRWERSEYGWYSQIGLALVGFLLVAVYAQVADWPRADLLTLVALVPLLPMSLWRASWAWRDPPG